MSAEKVNVLKQAVTQIAKMTPSKPIPIPNASVNHYRYRSRYDGLCCCNCSPFVCEKDPYECQHRCTNCPNEAYFRRQAGK